MFGKLTFGAWKSHKTLTTCSPVPGTVPLASTEISVSRRTHSKSTNPIEPRVELIPTGSSLREWTEPLQNRFSISRRAGQVTDWSMPVRTAFAKEPTKSRSLAACKLLVASSSFLDGSPEHLAQLSKLYPESVPWFHFFFLMFRNPLSLLNLCLSPDIKSSGGRVRIMRCSTVDLEKGNFTGANEQMFGSSILARHHRIGLHGLPDVKQFNGEACDNSFRLNTEHCCAISVLIICLIFLSINGPYPRNINNTEAHMVKERPGGSHFP